MADEQTIEDLIGPPPGPRPQAAAPGQPGQEQTIEDIIGPAPGPRPAYQPPATIYDRIFHDPQNPYGKLLGDFGMGFSEGYGTGPLGVGEETEKWMRDNGVWQDEQKKQEDIKNAWSKGQIWPLIPGLGHQILYEGIQRPAQAFQFVQRGFQGVVSGLSAAGGGVAEQTGIPQVVSRAGGQEYQPGQLGAEVAQGVQSEFMAPGALHAAPAEISAEAPEAAAARTEAVSRLNPQQPATVAGTIRDAKSMGIIGTLKNDEGVWKGTVDAPYPAPAPLAARAADAEAGIPSPPSEPIEPPAEPPDIHAVARQLAPDTFSEYDPLATRKATFQRWLGEMQRDQIDEATGPYREQIADLEAKMQDATPRLTKKYQARIDDLNDQLDDARQGALADTPDMAKIREQLQRVDYRMRDLAPEVSDAYRRAQEQIGPAAEEAETPVGAEPPPAEPEAPAAQVIPAAAEQGEPVVTAEEVIPHPNIAAEMESNKDLRRSWAGLDAADRRRVNEIESHLPKNILADNEEHMRLADEQEALFEKGRSQLREKVSAIGQEAPAAAPRASALNIADDVSQKLVQAGRPQEEADAAAQIVAAHYEARADRFGGAKGSPDEMYQRDAAQIKGGEIGGRAGGASGKAQVKNGRTIITLFRKADASTFLHETGHHWLEELMSDAKDEQAPQAVKDDAAAVRKWAGADQTGTLTTRQHEKFARAFERYFLEGRAPSSRLAGVFEQFKGWLGQIYGAASKMREAITPDIRDVFDRLLTKPSERAVTAPEPAKEFADIHEADAAHTPPARAAEAADTIEQEIDQLAAQRAPQIAEAIHGPETARPDTGEPGAGNAGAAGVAGEPTPAGSTPGGGREPEPVGAGEGTGGQPAAQPGRGTTTQAEGAAAPTRQPVATGRTVGATAGEAGERPVGPHSKLVDAPGRYVDKAGNIRLENLNTPEDLNRYFREMAEQNDDFMAARRGVVSDAQAMDAADAMGLKASDLSIQRLRQEFSAERIYATRQLFIQAGADVSNAAKLAAQGDLGSLAAYAEARSRLRMVQEYLSAITAEAGRGLRAFRNVGEGFGKAKDLAALVGDFQETKTLFQMQEEAKRISELDTPAKVNKVIRDADKPSLGGMLLESFVNGLISNPITHTTYAVGNATLALWKTIPETMVAAGLGRIKEILTGAPIEERVRLQETGAQVYALMKGQRDGFRAAWQSMKSGQTAELPQEIMDRMTGPQRSKYDDAIADGASHDQALKIAGSMSDIKTPFTQTKQIPGVVGAIVRAPGERMVAPIHSYFRTMNYERGIAALAVRQAFKEGAEGDRFNMRVADLTQNPTPAMMEAARAQATELTLMGHGGELTRRFGALTKWEPNIPLLGKTKPIAFIDPFVTISSNIISQSLVERSPLGLLSGKIREDLSGRNGTVAQTEAASRMLCGTALAMVGGGLAAEGIITGSGPSDPHKAMLWRAQYGQPHSIRIGNMSYDLSHLGVLGFGLGIAADAYHSFHEMEKGNTIEAAQNLAHSFAQNFLDQSFMKGVSDLMKALDDNDRYGESYARNLVASGLPFSSALGQAAHMVDPFQRQARTILDAVKAKIPWESETLQPRIDIWGQPIPNKEFVGLYATRLANDPVNKAILELPGAAPGLPERKITGIELNDRQYTQYCQIAGQIAHNMLAARVANPMWSQMPVLIRHDIVKTAIEGSRAMARARLKIGSIGSDNDIIAKALGNKRAQMDAEPVNPDDF